MTSRTGIARRIAAALVDRAARWLPPRRCEWGDAMRAELHHVKSDRHALEWALGCVLASLTERVRAMNVSSLRVSRWLLVLEWLVCFGPLTLLWIAAVTFIGRGAGPSSDLIAAMLLGALGPIALVAALIGTVFPGAFPRRWLIKSLLLGFFVLGSMQFLAMVKTLGFRWFAFDWSLIVLLAVLPLLGCLHLHYASRLATSDGRGGASMM
jgi:hypothetical protein